MPGARSPEPRARVERALCHCLLPAVAATTPIASVATAAAIVSVMVATFAAAAMAISPRRHHAATDRKHQNAGQGDSPGAPHKVHVVLLGREIHRNLKNACDGPGLTPFVRGA